jgi:hypothetical protein
VGLVGVDDDDPVGHQGGKPVEDVQGEVAFGVDDDHAAAGFDVVDGHVAHLGALAGAGGAEDFRAAPAGRDRHRRRYGFGAGPVEPGDVDVGGQGGDGGQFLGGRPGPARGRGV